MIRVDSIENLLTDVADFLVIDISRLYLKIIDIYNEASFDDDKIIQLSREFITECTNKQIDYIYLCHLTRNIDYPPVLFPLQTILTTENSLSSFLEDNGLKFEYDNCEIKMKYDNNIIPRSVICPHGEK